VLAPYLGLVTSVLCALGGAWLLLAPYALDIRRGAAKLPRAAAVDLETGAAIVAVALLSAILFAVALFSRLRPQAGLIEFEMAAAEPETDSDTQPETQPDTQSETQAQSQPDPEAPAASAASNSSSALREMLTPLVAALAADLRSQGPRQEP
jgi:hypothetical protein